MIKPAPATNVIKRKCSETRNMMVLANAEDELKTKAKVSHRISFKT